MGFEADRVANEGRVFDDWSATKVKYENVEFDPPGDDDYIAVFIREAEANQKAMPAEFRYRGVIIFQIYVNKDTGTKSMREYQDLLTTLFRGVQFSGITCRTPYPTPGRVVGEHYQSEINVPYQRDTSA